MASQSSSVSGEDQPKKAPSKPIPKKEEEYALRAMLNALSEALETNFGHLLERIDELKEQLDQLAAAPASTAQLPPQIVYKTFRRGGRGGRGGGYNSGRGFPRL
jgi:hypothetical protein